MSILCSKVLVLVFAASLPVAGQQGPVGGAETSHAAPPNVQNSGAKAIPVPSTANSPEVLNPELRPVVGRLAGKLDARNAKAGDLVLLRTTENTITARGIEIPKGSRIVGHITAVETKEQGGDSRITIQFDKAEINGRRNLAIRSVLQAVGTSAAAASDASRAQPGSDGSPGGSQPGVATLQGGSAAGTAPTAARPGAPKVGTVIAHSGSLAIRTTAVPGVLLAGNDNGQPLPNAAGALVGSRQDVHLDGGTVMVVAIAVIPRRGSTR